jgi:microsomal epoxide hydrolase
LLLIHGWPGSIFEFLETIGPLTDPAAHGGDPNDAFDVVIPALPGFGFGGKPEIRGWGVGRIAAAFDTLMREHLDYERYGAQGGDWGTVVCGRLGLDHPESLVGIHVNMPYASPPEGESDPFGYQEDGYFHVQSTKPDTVTAAQADSPAGLAAWIVEKFRAWGACDRDVESAFSKDTLLTNLMFYWAPNSTASAARIYYEAFRDTPRPFRHEQVRVPTGVARFPGEPIAVPRAWLEPLYTIVHWTDMPRGGHFAALEAPDLLVDDVRAFFRPFRS